MTSQQIHTNTMSFESLSVLVLARSPMSKFSYLLSEEEKKPAAYIDCDEALPDHHPPMDADILSQGSSSSDSLTEI